MFLSPTGEEWNKLVETASKQQLEVTTAAPSVASSSRSVSPSSAATVTTTMSKLTLTLSNTTTAETDFELSECDKIRRKPLSSQSLQYLSKSEKIGKYSFHFNYLINNNFKYFINFENSTDLRLS